MGSPRCAYCGDIATTNDHVIPLSVGGVNGAENRVKACLRCNGMKSAMNPKEWLDHMKRVVEYIERHHRVEHDGSITLWVK